MIKILNKNKKAEGTPIWIIIALVLGLLVLVMMAFGFTKGWGNLWTKMTDWTGGGAGTASSLAQTCSLACASGDINSYCKTPRSVSGLTDVQTTDLVKSVKKTPSAIYTIKDSKVIVSTDPKEDISISGKTDSWSMTNYGSCNDYKAVGVIAISDCANIPSCA